MKNKRILRGISLIVSIFVVIQLFPVSAFAALVIGEISTNTSVKDSNTVPSVVAEVIEERDEYSKVYLLEDGSYYKVSTYAPIHEKINGEWENIEGFQNSDTKNIETVESILQQVSIEQADNSDVSLMSDSPTETEVNNNLEIACINAQKLQEDGSISFGSRGMIFVKPQNLKYYLNQNKIVIDANISVNCFAENGHASNAVVNLRELSVEWNENTVSEDLGNFRIANQKLVGCNTIVNSATYSWDITELYSRWDRGMTENNGFALHSTSSKCNLILSSMYISVRYKDIDENDLDSTYHSLAMGRAGTLYINDITGIIKLEQELLNIDRVAFPISLKRIFGLDSLPTDISSGMNFRWNYESNIVLDEEIVKWKMFDGTTRCYIQSTPVETVGDYQKWEETGKVNELSTDNSFVWIKTSELENSEYDYSNFYAEIDDITYTFDFSGRVIRLQKSNDTNTSLFFNYSNDMLTSIAYNDNNNITQNILLDVSENGSGMVRFTSVNNISGESSSQVLIEFESNYNETENYTNYEITYSDDKKVVYTFDTSGRLLEITNETGDRVVLSYENAVADVIDNRLNGYEKITMIDETESSVESLSINFDNTYQRVFKNERNDEEKINYDNNYNVVFHESYLDDCTFATYDENNIIKSFTVNEKIEQEILQNPSFEIFSGGETSDWDWDDYAIEVVSYEDELIDKYSDTADAEEWVARFSSNNSFSASIYKENIQLEPDTTYVFGTWVYIDDAIPSSDRPVSMRIETSNTGEVIAEIIYDTSLYNQWQYRLAAFKIDGAETNVNVSINYEDQAGTIYVDAATLHKSASAVSDFSESVDALPYVVTKNSDGLVSNESLSDGTLSLVRSYEYTDNQISSITDTDGLTTYYMYNPVSSKMQVGTIKENNKIMNPKEFTYDKVTGNLNSISQIVGDISSDNTMEMVTNYAYDGDRISSITHNNLVYLFNYTGDKLTSVDVISENSVEDAETKLIEYGYNSVNNIGQIIYKNGLVVIYVYDSENKISQINYYINDNLYKSCSYTYDSDGNIETVIDTESGLKIVYINDGYELYRNNGEDWTLLYKIVNNNDGSVTETYMPGVFVVGETPKSFITTSDDVVSLDTTTKLTTKASTVAMNKITDWTDSNDYDESIVNYSRRSVIDYFGRISEKTVEMQTLNNNGESGKKTETYTYKEVSSGVTSTLVASYATTIVMSNHEDNILRTAFSTEMFYEYDKAGNIIFVYSKDDLGNCVPKVYYEYDSANQLIGELNYDKGISVTYTYDLGGNITSKIIYNINTAVVDASEHKVTSYGTVTDSVLYNYDTVWKNRLNNYDGITISYDSLGNPLNYVGKTFRVSSDSNDLSTLVDIDNSVSANLEWLGGRLVAFETDEDRFEYSYDENGYRTKKVVYDKNINEFGSYDYELDTEMTYIWDNGVLKSVINASHSAKPVHSDIMYDQEGNMTGFVSNLGAVFYFVKDSNGSVKNLIDENGAVVASFNYDAWGHMSVKIHADTSTIGGEILYAVYAAILVLNPVAYNGYLFDYESGLYFSKDMVYSPAWGRYLNCADYSVLLEKTDSPISANLYTFCNNNPVNVFDVYGVWNRNDIEYTWLADGFTVNMSEAFLSRVFCTVFASQLIRINGKWDYNNGYNYCGMNVNDIATSLFAHSVGKYATSAINKVNASWGDGWILNNSKSDVIEVLQGDPNAWKYKKIWYAAADIRMYAWSNGIYITL